jgi:hypothetical protein
MDALKEHTIAFSGLKDGAHAFQFQLGEAFFSAAGEEEMEGGEVLVDVALDHVVGGRSACQGHCRPAL